MFNLKSITGIFLSVFLLSENLTASTTLDDSVVEELAKGAYLHLDRVDTKTKVFAIECFVISQRKKIKPVIDDIPFLNKYLFSSGVVSALSKAEQETCATYDALEFLALAYKTSTVGEYCSFETAEIKETISQGGSVYDKWNLREKSDAYVAYISSSPESSASSFSHMLKHVEMIVSVNTSKSLPWYTTLGICRSLFYTGEKHKGVSLYLQDFVARQFVDKPYMLFPPVKKMSNLVLTEIGGKNAQVLKETKKSDRWVQINLGVFGAGQDTCTYRNESGKNIKISNYKNTWFSTNPSTFGSHDDSDKAPLVAVKRKALASYAKDHPYLKK